MRSPSSPGRPPAKESITWTHIGTGHVEVVLSTGGGVDFAPMAVSETRSLGALFALLEPFNPLLAGTFPLGVQTRDSDLDILCEVPSLAAFEEFLAANPLWFDGAPGHRLTTVDPHAHVVGLQVSGVPVEIFAQPVPVHQQVGFRHMVVEARLLAVAGPQLAHDVRRMKAQGLKTEPAFAELLGLDGDPYDALLGVEDRPAEDLARARYEPESAEEDDR